MTLWLRLKLLADVGLVGLPNVGKSSLVNSFMGYKLSIITAKAQTTRHRIFCILNSKNFQFVFSDTPGLIEPKNKLHESMMNFVKSSYDDADIIIYVVDASSEEIINKNFKLKLKSLSIPVIIVINKIDLINNEKLHQLIEEIKNDFTDSFIFPISVKENFNVKIFREKILKFYNKEIPYAVEVVTNSFKYSNKILKIDSTIYVERSTQKGILIGHKGKSLTEIGKKSRIELENFFNKKVFLEIRVKVSKNWKSSRSSLKRFGYDSN